MPEGPTSAEAWNDFETRLGETLLDLSEDECLIVAGKDTDRYVQFVAQGPRCGMRAEVASNQFLPPDGQLSAANIKALLTLGWHPPTYELVEGIVEPPDGSPNFYLDVAAGVPFSDIAALAVRTLRGALDVRHPGELKYLARTVSGDATIRFPSLHLKFDPTE